MDKCLYLECQSGISGDMMAAALLDLGANRQVLGRALDSLCVDGFAVEISRVKKSGLDVCDFNVKLDAAHENHDHDMEYLYGGFLHGKEGLHQNMEAEGQGGSGRLGEERSGEKREHTLVAVRGNMDENDPAYEHLHDKDYASAYIYAHEAAQLHSHGGSHSHEHVNGFHDQMESHVHESGHNHSEDARHHVPGHLGDGHVHSEAGHGHSHPKTGHTHAHDHPGHVHRGLEEILSILRKADMTERARDTAERIFRILAQAEAKAHGLGIEEVHFHEVGAVDSIVDIVTVAVCLDDLGITRTVIPKLCEGRGSVRCQHGVIPVPVPAVVNIAQAHGLKLKITDVEGELVTPTGAAIVAAIGNVDHLPEEFEILKVGMGAGKRNYERPSILRAMLIDGTQPQSDQICKLETNIDDCSGEMLGYVMDRLLEAGAKDVHYSPVFMKKNRPAYQLNVICGREDAAKLERIIFSETTTIGIRRVEMERSVLPRREIRVSTSLGEASVKVCVAPDEDRYYPEYDSVVELAREHGLPFGEVYELVKRESRKEEV